MIANQAHITQYRVGPSRTVRVEFDQGQRGVYETGYRKSWSHKRYVDAALKELKLIASYGFHYSWDDNLS